MPLATSRSRNLPAVSATRSESQRSIHATINKRSENGGIHMILRLIITAAIALLFASAALVFSQEHPEHPQKTTEHPKQGAETKQVSTTDISAGIKTNIDEKSKKSPDGKFPVDQEAPETQHAWVKVQDDGRQDTGE